MTWAQIRAEYARLFAEAQTRDGATQQSVARRGGLKNQNAISKLLTNTKRGPSVETFLKAVEGLGLNLTTFLATLEGSTSSPSDRKHEPLPLENRRVSDGTSSTSHPVGSLVISTRIEQITTGPSERNEVASLIREHIEALRQFGNGKRSPAQRRQRRSRETA